MDINEVAVIGGGTMGSGIAHVFALKGFGVTLVETRKDLLDKALAAIKANMTRQVEKKALSAEDSGRAFKRIKGALELIEAQRAQLVIEAVPEDLGIKRKVFSALDAACPPETILATNTSALSVTEIAAATKRADRVIGMHFMNPVPVMKLVELIRGLETSDATFKTIGEVTLKLGKNPACSKDFPGFVSNRVLMPMINEACFVLMEGVSSREDIDTVMKLGMNHPMGPLQLADYIGLDVCLAVMEVLHEGYGDSKYRPCPLLRQMAQAGRLGRKNGRGFYDY